MEFLYESGLGVGKGSSDGFQALQQPGPAAAAASSSAQASAGSSKVLQLFLISGDSSPVIFVDLHLFWPKQVSKRKKIAILLL